MISLSRWLLGHEIKPRGCHVTVGFYQMAEQPRVRSISMLGISQSAPGISNGAVTTAPLGLMKMLRITTLSGWLQQFLIFPYICDGWLIDHYFFQMSCNQPVRMNGIWFRWTVLGFKTFTKFTRSYDCLPDHNLWLYVGTARLRMKSCVANFLEHPRKRASKQTPNVIHRHHRCCCGRSLFMIIMIIKIINITCGALPMQSIDTEMTWMAHSLPYFRHVCDIIRCYYVVEITTYSINCSICTSQDDWSMKLCWYQSLLCLVNRC